jgi:hypothetical protein
MGFCEPRISQTMMAFMEKNEDRVIFHFHSNYAFFNISLSQESILQIYRTK